MNETLLQELFRKYRNQSLNREEEALFFNLLQHPQYKGRVEALLRELWRETERFEHAPLTPAGKRRIALVMAKVAAPKKTIKRRFTPLWAAAASVVVFIGLALFYRSSQQVRPAPLEAPRIAEIKTNYGEKKRATLPDGTHIHLNAGSILRYDNTYNKDKREIELIGEAFFEVAPDELRPFIVRSQQLETYVLGTSFNVRAFEEDENLFVALIAGSVRVDDGSSSLLLKPGEKINYNKRTATSEVSAIQEKDYWGLWRKEVLAFNEQRFEDVATLLEKWYGVQIHIHNKALLKRRFTGEFKDLAINKVLDMLSKSSPFTYHIENDQVYIK